MERATAGVYAIENHRLYRARHEAANQVMKAQHKEHMLTARMWMRVVADVDKIIASQTEPAA